MRFALVTGMSITLFTGSRTLNQLSYIETAVTLSGFDVTLIVQGEAKQGADFQAKIYAQNKGIPLANAKFPADWERYGRRAGMVRNLDMVRHIKLIGHPDNAQVIAIWDKKSSGTRNAIANAIWEHMPTYVYYPLHGYGSHIEIEDGKVRAWAYDYRTTGH